MGTISLVIPQIGQPDTTEDVKLQNALTTIQTVINGNLDPSNVRAASGIVTLQARTVTANTTAVAGDWVRATSTPPYTITLPASTANAVVAVTAATNLVSGSAPVTIAPATGQILGVGDLGSSSIVLGAPIASVVLMCDGTNWYIVAGQQDTGWVALGGLTGGITAATGFYAPGARKLGDRVYLRGGIQAPAGSGTVAWSTSAPTGMTPASSTGFAVGFNSQLPVAASLVQGSSGFSNSAGTISIPNIPVSQVAMLDGISYSIS